MISLELLAFAFLVLTVLDVLTTNHAIDRGAHETNPIMATAMKLLGGKWWLIKALAVVLTFAFKEVIGVPGLVAMNVITLAVVLWNLYQIVAIRRGRQ